MGNRRKIWGLIHDFEGTLFERDRLIIVALGKIRNDYKGVG
jgi:hypothetical protein